MQSETLRPRANELKGVAGFWTGRKREKVGTGELGNGGSEVGDVRGNAERHLNHLQRAERGGSDKSHEVRLRCSQSEISA